MLGPHHSWIWINEKVKYDRPLKEAGSRATLNLKFATFVNWFFVEQSKMQQMLSFVGNSLHLVVCLLPQSYDIYETSCIYIRLLNLSLHWTPTEYVTLRLILLILNSVLAWEYLTKKSSHTHDKFTSTTRCGDDGSGNAMIVMKIMIIHICTHFFSLRVIAWHNGL